MNDKRKPENAFFGPHLTRRASKIHRNWFERPKSDTLVSFTNKLSYNFRYIRDMVVG